MATQAHTAPSYINAEVIKADHSIDPTLGAALGHSALELGNFLQTTLDINELIALFADKIIQSVAYRGLHYVNQADDVNIHIGGYSAHMCTYQLTIEDNSLGALTIYPQKPLKENELVVLENMMCALVYPLRNALLYTSALRSAHIDPLTGINNRAGMNAAIKREISLGHRHNTPMSVMMLDIDHFKRINDNYGHASGDAVLQTVAKCIKDSIRGSDAVFRFGGEEFLIVLSSTEMKGAIILAERIRQQVEQLSFGTQKGLKATASIGVTSLSSKDSITTLFERVDNALYSAKHDGRNRVVSTPPPGESHTN
ncbi:diguanylate cyclase (GGDEF domain) [hydrothermal vent metagenome]|uniref:Diguanylate cyclase (GGDEF domain) n=1 Tax=hydrothermal vent metagenome TaxID=652676 RepID=A0A3B1B637_9ZZZZ